MNLEGQIRSLEEQAAGMSAHHEERMANLGKELASAQARLKKWESAKPGEPMRDYSIREARALVDKYQAEIDTYENIHQSLYKPLVAELNLARTTFEAEQASKEKARKEEVAILEAEAKERTKRAWIMNGGDPNKFDEVWPALYNEQLKEKVSQDLADQEAARQAYARSLRDIF